MGNVSFPVSKPLPRLYATENAEESSGNMAIGKNWEGEDTKKEGYFLMDLGNLGPRCKN